MSLYALSSLLSRELTCIVPALLEEMSISLACGSMVSDSFRDDISQVVAFPAHVHALLDLLPDSPGVYRYYDAERQLLYVGKAKSLRSRVRSYFQPRAQHGARTRRLVERVDHIEWIITTTEAEALMLEANLINELQPPFNVLLRDDKSVLYVSISSEPFPRISFVRRPRKKSSAASLFGPFGQGKHIRFLVESLREVLQFRTCHVDISPEGQTLRNPEQRKIPCLDHQIARCSAPCAARISMEEYLQNIDLLRRYLKGDIKPLKERVTSLMLQAAETRAYEKAGRMKQILEGMDRDLVDQVAEIPVDLNADIIGLYEGDRDVHVSVFAMRYGRLVRSHSYRLPAESDLSRSLQNFLREYRSLMVDPPSFLLVPPLLSEDETEALTAYFSEEQPHKVTVQIPARGARRRLVALAHDNAERAARDSQAAWQKVDPLDQLQEALHLQKTPMRIECYDISHLGGTHTVASQVTFFDAQPLKSSYRHYQIRSLESGQIDDFQSMHEVMTRRTRALDESRSAFGVESVLMPEEISDLALQRSEEGLIDWQEPESVYRFSSQEGAFLGSALIRSYGSVQEVGGFFLLEQYRGQGISVPLLRTFLLTLPFSRVRAIVPESAVAWHQKLEQIGFRREKRPPKALEPTLSDRTERDGLVRRVYALSLASLRRTTSVLPDLIVIDGGKGQLNAAHRALEASGYASQIALCSLAKRLEEVYIVGRSEPIALAPDTPASRLLQQMRDEAHRFAVSHNRSLRDKSQTASRLDAVSGLGQKTRTQLLEHFSSVDAVFSASESELRLLLGERRGRDLFLNLQGHTAPSAEETDDTDENSET